MGCNNNAYAKSCQRYYNNNTQALAAGETISLTVAGTKVVDSGISIETNTQSFEVVKSGLYHITGDVVVDSTAAGDVTLYVLMDGVELPCATKTVTVPASGYTEIHTETDIGLVSCCAITGHTITFALASTGTAAGSVTNFCAGMLKLA